MHVVSIKFNKKTAVLVVVLAALVLIGIVMLVNVFTGMNNAREIINVRNESSRVAYLSQNGWVVETPALNAEKVVIPRTFSEVFDSYNDLQVQQGFDLSQYCGTEVDVYTYKVTNYDGDDYVVAQMYVYHGTVIGGDVHSTALDGFMTGLKPLS